MFKIGLKYKTDKITHHGYHRFYDYFLIPYKHKHFNFFEIGINTGRSLRTWNEFFTNAKIYGMDIDHEYDHDRGKIFKGDQSKKTHLAKIVKAIKTSEFIIDDGSHVSRHITSSFKLLWGHVKIGGYYFIEDLHAGHANRPETIRIIKEWLSDKPHSMILTVNDKLLIIEKK